MLSYNNIRQFETILSINKTRAYSLSLKGETMKVFEEISSVRKLTVSAVVMALYIAVMFVTQSFAFGAIQVRIATSLYAIGALNPFFILPLGLANALSNLLFGGLGIWDIIGGFVVGIMTATACWMASKAESRIGMVLIAFSIILIPGLIAPIWLSTLLSEATYTGLVVSLLLGQTIPGIVGAILYKNIILKEGFINAISGRK